MWKLLQLFIFSWTSSININIKGAKGNHAIIHMLHVRDQYYTEFWINESGDVWGVCLRLSSASHLHPSHPLFLEWCTYAHYQTPHPPNLPPVPPTHTCLLSLPEILLVTTGKVTRSSGRVQTETPLASLSLFSASKPTHGNLPWFPLDMGSTWELKAPRNGSRNSVPCASSFVFDQMSRCVHIWHWAHLCLMGFSFAFKNGWIMRQWCLSNMYKPPELH